MKLFKLQIHDDKFKDIIVLSCRVVSSKRFEEMTNKSKKEALKAIEIWEASLQAFKERLKQQNEFHKIKHRQWCRCIN